MRHLETVMGMPMSVEIPGTGSIQEFEESVRLAFDSLHAADARFSPVKPHSELSRMVRGEVTDLSVDMREVLGIAERAEQLSGGAFRCRTPEGGWDTNGVVKGWAAQRAADILEHRGITNFCLNAAGDLVTRGCPEPDRTWQIGIRDPGDHTRIIATLAMGDGAVATSGTYERGQHIWDGRTGQPALSLASATVVAADLTTADVLATSVVALGPSGVEWAVENGATMVVAITPQGDVLTASMAIPAK